MITDNNKINGPFYVNEPFYATSTFANAFTRNFKPSFITALWSNVQNIMLKYWKIEQIIEEKSILDKKGPFFGHFFDLLQHFSIFYLAVLYIASQALENVA